MRAQRLLCHSADRRGIALILSLGLLTLFTIVALTLASISRTQSTAAANFKRAEQFGTGDVGLRPREVQGLFRHAMNQLIYDTRNPYSAIRGHSLARDMYGSPAKPTFNGTDITNIEGGAELRFAKDDLKRLLGIPLNPATDNDPRLDYQGVYNGTGLFLPRNTVPNGLPAAANRDVAYFQLNRGDIAMQTMFMSPPGNILPTTPNNNISANVATFRQIYTNPNSTHANTRYWLPMFPVNYMQFDAFTSAAGRLRLGTTPLPDGSMPEPEKFMYRRNPNDTNVTTGTGAMVEPVDGEVHWFGADEDYDYPDVNNMFLAMERADGRILIPSFHRPGLIHDVTRGMIDVIGPANIELPRRTLVNPLNSNLYLSSRLAWLTTEEYSAPNNNSSKPLPNMRRLVMRPRAADYDPGLLGFQSPKAGRFREMSDAFDTTTAALGQWKYGQDGLPDDLDGSGFIGDHPSELDVDSDGDGLNDAVWIDLGYPVMRVGDATFKPLFAFKVIDLDSKINLNAHGNHYTVGNVTSRARSTPEFPIVHTSNLGASPTEINPQHAMIVGDPEPTATNVNPQKPYWTYSRGQLINGRVAAAAPGVSNPSTTHPYQRLVEGYTDAAGNYHPGKYSTRSGDATTRANTNAAAGLHGADDEFEYRPDIATNLAGPAAGSPPGLEEAYQNNTLPYQIGDGVDPIRELPDNLPGSPQKGIPANASFFSPIDDYGLGRVISPLSKSGLYAGAGSTPRRTLDLLPWIGISGVTDVDEVGNLVGVPLNYTDIAGPQSGMITYRFGASLNQVSKGIPWTDYSVAATINDSLLSASRSALDEATEINLYLSENADDTLFTAVDTAALLRAGDVDASAQESRLANLWPQQLRNRNVDVSQRTSTATPNFYSRELYAKKRMQHLFTHANWDLIRYNAPPTFRTAAQGSWLGSSVPNQLTDLLEISGRANSGVLLASPNGVANQVLRRHAGATPNVIMPQMLAALGMNLGSLPIDAHRTRFEDARRAINQLCARRTFDGKDFLVPYEVQMGRRFDLNRPLTAYALTSTDQRINDPYKSTPVADPALPNPRDVDPIRRTPEQVDDERESLAQQIYVLLCISSGLLGDDGVAEGSTKLASVKLRIAQARTLAQLAVNIVDYMDPDSVMTVMHFDPYLADGWAAANGQAIQKVWGDPPAVASMPAIPVDPNTGSAYFSPTAEDWASTCTVIGFELPELVINETMAVILENWAKKPDGGMPPMDVDVRYELQHTWVELLNPWPDGPDPVNPRERGIKLFDNLLNEPRFMLGLSDPSSELTAVAPDPTVAVLAAQNPRRFVTFNPADTADGVPIAGTPDRIIGRDGAKVGSEVPGYFVVGPRDPQTIDNAVNGGQGAGEKLLLPAGTWDPSNLQNFQDYTAKAFGQVVWNVSGTNNNARGAEAKLDVKLYRKRNPFAVWNKTTNPYVVIDYVHLELPDQAAARPLQERKADGTLDAETAPSKHPSGLYFIIDPTPATGMGNGNKPIPGAPAEIAEGARLSWQRRQPWHGWNSEWNPYGVKDQTVALASDHPLVGNAIGVSGTELVNVEGYFLGQPSLATLNPKNTTTVHTNAMRQNGFWPDLPTFINTDRRSPKRTARWMTFPFLNRQLATPLELLSVRMYGSYRWTINPGVDYEWRMRFTDDFEFVPHAYKVIPRSGWGGPDQPYYERVWRSRQAPWYQDNRVGHPTWGSISGTNFDFFLANNLDPTTVATNHLANSPEVQMPMPHLYRFFELVECRSKMNNGLRAGSEWYLDKDTTATLPAPVILDEALKINGASTVPEGYSYNAGTLRTRRQDRVPGKINLNTVTEEEVYKGLLDSLSTMFFSPAEYIAYWSQYQSAGKGPLPTVIPTVSATFWPIEYWECLFTPLGTAPLAFSLSPSDAIDATSQLVPWGITFDPLVSNTAAGDPERGLSMAISRSKSVITKPLTNGSTVGPALATGGFDFFLFKWFNATTVSDLTTLAPRSGNNYSTAQADARNNVTGTNSPNRQFPGIMYGPDGDSGAFPGTDPKFQVSSEMYRAFLLSRSGPDGITGTGDDRPFRSFASDLVSDTILRPRNFQTANTIRGSEVTVNASSGAAIPDFSWQAYAQARSFTDGVDEAALVNVGSTNTFYMGDYITRLAGQATPRLFDPIADPFLDDVSSSAADPNLLLWYVAAGVKPTESNWNNDPFKKRLPGFVNDAIATGLAKDQPADYWMLEERRNQLLAKIGGNVTTRSHVFAVWVTVGFFRVEPGTETLKVPLLGSEAGSETGKPVRHRAFFIVDRSQIKAYDADDIDANYDLNRLRSREVLEYYRIIE